MQRLLILCFGLAAAQDLDFTSSMAFIIKLVEMGVDLRLLAELLVISGHEKPR